MQRYKKTLKPQKNIPEKILAKITKKYNNPLPTLNILYSKVQATFTIPSKHLEKYNKSPLHYNKKKGVKPNGFTPIKSI